MWLQNLKEHLQLIDKNSIQRYIKCHIMLLFGGVTRNVETDAIDILVLLTLGSHWMIFRKARRVFIKEFVWVAYGVDHIDPDIIPTDIYMHSVVWSATVPLVSFKCIEWHGVPHQEQNLDKAHEEVLTSPKNLDWATATTHSFWVMQWTNRYNHVLTELPVPPQHPLDIYMYWYRTKYGNHLNLSDLVA
ncbi:hypothetical protein Ahy_B01g056701 isoform A [Arachis hypogaea]|uniref:Aminotransferase-like plant mobile domain-containing protein n=1 Tax=Arachis hypogaea TaxID=3818 RepID=A0A445AZG8_ARAHY|nr:hypothetical protein Ahy_B01g056701 isoform A [Arachis hypogaea]